MFRALLGMALGALRVNWFRATLTALGVIIGAASLVTVSAVSAGAQREVTDSINRLGGNIVKIDGEVVSHGTQQTATDRTLTPADVEAVGSAPHDPGRWHPTRTSRASRSRPDASRRAPGSSV